MDEENSLFKSETVRQAYEARRTRYLTAMGGGTPDRIPIRFFLQEAAARFCGKTNQNVAIDYNQAFECTRLAGERLRLDATMLNAIWSTYSVAKAAGWKYLHVPSVDTGIENVFQFTEPAGEENAFLREDEYEEFAEDPTAFLLNKWFARNAHGVVPAGAPVTLDHNANLMRGALAFSDYMHAFGPAAARLKYESGIVSANAGMIKAPLDILMDKFRGYENTVCDCIECPERVLKACEALIPHIVANALNGADPTKEVPITLWAHRGCVPFISPQIFERIYWPTLKIVLEELFARGHQVLFYSEGNWEAHYDAFRTLPEHSLIFHLTNGSAELAARKLKDRFAISGGLDYLVLAQGSTADVEAHLKHLFNWLKPGGGYMLDATSLMMNDVKPENLVAAVRYTLDHGSYSQTTPAHAIGPCAATNPAPGKRAPNTVRSWEEESAGYRNLTGDVDSVRRCWQGVDAALYGYLWTTVLW